MRISSSTVKIAGLTGTEAGRVMARLRHMQSTGILSKEISVERTDTSATDESLRLRSYGGL